MLHDNRDRVRQRVEIPPQSPELAANTHRRNRAIEFLQSPADRSQFRQRVRELRADLAPWRLIAHADARAENVPHGPTVIEASSRRADQQSAFSPHRSRASLFDRGGAYLERVSLRLLSFQPAPGRAVGGIVAA
jgi:hypothetical protein